jgi:CheY-like chemotaxis protein
MPFGQTPQDRAANDMAEHYAFYLVDDDRVANARLTKLLASEQHHVCSSTSGGEALPAIMAQPPDCVVLDIMMPDMDGLELCRRLRQERRLQHTKIVILSGKTYEFDRQRAYRFGADGYLTKPVEPETIVAQLTRIIEDYMELTFWGVRGTLPVPGKQAIRYGGNTSCLSLEFPKGNLFIFDAGTGIKALASHLTHAKRSEIEAKIFISHPHWDHINALPFFGPLYVQGNEFAVFGPSHGDITVRELIAGQMDGVYFPIQIKEFGATVTFHDLKEETFETEGVQVSTMLLNHPGHCLGYRITYNGRSLCYITDNELFPRTSHLYNPSYVEKLQRFVHGAKALVIDTAYSDSEYPAKMCWGHAPVSEVVALADQAQVNCLYLFHHDPDQTDADIDAKLHSAQSLLQRRQSQTTCVAPREGDAFRI